jgi:hypothetical protein
MPFNDCDRQKSWYGLVSLLFQHERATRPVPLFEIELRCGLRISPRKHPAMKTTRKVWASLLTLLVACLVQAADPKPVARVIAITDVETDDPSGYATWISQYNQVAKAKLGIDQYLRVYESQMDGTRSGRVRAVASASSVAELMKNAVALESDIGIVQNRQHLNQIRKVGARVLYQALRWDGTIKNSSNYNTLANVTDEAGYLKALDQLRTIFDAVGLKDAKIAAYRVIAGRSDHTHRITISTPSPERLAAFLDLAATNPQLNEWLASSAKLRTVVANSTSREITK